MTAGRIAEIFDKWPEAVALGEKMDFVQVCTSDDRSHAIIGEALKRGKPVCGHMYGREFVSAYAASGVTDTHEAIDKDIADDMLEAAFGYSCEAVHQQLHGILFLKQLSQSSKAALLPSEFV